MERVAFEQRPEGSLQHLAGEFPRQRGMSIATAMR